MKEQKKRLWLVQYLMKKNEVLRKAGATMDLTVPEDLEELLGWDDSSIIEVYKSAKKALYDMKRGPNISMEVVLCPWCVKHDSKCTKCEYGNRHGRCGDNNRFRKIQNQIGGIDMLTRTIASSLDVFADLMQVETQQRVKNPVAIMKVLIAEGYTVSEDGEWQLECTEKKEYFVPEMWQYCGTNPTDNTWTWVPEWLESVAVLKT